MGQKDEMNWGEASLVLLVLLAQLVRPHWVIQYFIFFTILQLLVTLQITHCSRANQNHDPISPTDTEHSTKYQLL